MKNFSIKLATLMFLSNIIFSTTLAQAAELTNFPSISYEDPFKWTEEKKSDYPCTDEGEFFLPTERIDNTANFYFYIEDSNSNIMSNQVYANTLVWRPVESEGAPILNTSITHMSLVATQPLMIKLNPYNLKKLETLEHGSVYYIQYGIPNGYFTANGNAAVNTSAYVNILTPNFELSENYVDVFLPTEQEEQNHKWLKADNNDLTFYAIYGTSDWIGMYFVEFQDWCKEHQENNSCSENDDEINLLENSDKEAAQDSSLDTDISLNPIAEPDVEITQTEYNKSYESTFAITKEMMITTVVVICAILALVFIKVRGKNR